MERSIQLILHGTRRRISDLSDNGKRRSFCLIYPKTKTCQDIWWRAYASNGKLCHCGLSSTDSRKDCESFDIDNSVFASMPYPSREIQFSPHEIVPIPGSGQCVHFKFDEKGLCRPSLEVVFVTNKSSKQVLVRVTDGDAAGVLVPSNVESQEIVFRDPQSPRNVLTVIVVDETSKTHEMGVSNGNTITVDAGLSVSRQSFGCPIPVYRCTMFQFAV